MQLVFLCYMSRSGSTFLAKELNKYKDILVGIEGEFNDGFYKPFPSIDNNESLYNYIESTYNSTFSKIKYWNIDKNKLFLYLKEKKYPITFKNFLYGILNLYFNGIENNEIVIHKAGIYHKYIDKIRSEFGDVKFIFINRDPRSIYNSQKKTTGSESGNPFTTSIEAFVKKYKDEHHLLKKHIGKDYLYILKYEDLIKSKEHVLEKIIKFVGSEGVKNDTRMEKEYYERIPEKQKIMHLKLKEKADTSRISPWKNELTLKENYILQKYLKVYIDYWKYENFNIDKSGIRFYISYLYSGTKYTKNQILLPWLRKSPSLYNSYKKLAAIVKK